MRRLGIFTRMILADAMRAMEERALANEGVGEPKVTTMGDGQTGAREETRTGAERETRPNGYPSEVPLPAAAGSLLKTTGGVELLARGEGHAPPALTSRNTATAKAAAPAIRLAHSASVETARR